MSWWNKTLSIIQIACLAQCLFANGCSSLILRFINYIELHTFQVFIVKSFLIMVLCYPWWFCGPHRFPCQHYSRAIFSCLVSSLPFLSLSSDKHSIYTVFNIHTSCGMYHATYLGSLSFLSHPTKTHYIFV